MSACLRSALLSRAGFSHGFSLRTGGVSAAPFDTLNLGRNVGDEPEAVAENHARFARAVGYDPARLYELSQVHGAALEQVDPNEPPASFRAREADAVWSAHGGCAVGIRVADCVPVLFADADSGAVAAVHAGWRGVVAGVVPRAVDALRRARGGRSLLAAIFPCIGPDAFEVGQDVAAQITGALGAAGSEVLRGGGPRPHVDLARAVELQLCAAGIAPEAIDRVRGCTFSERARFFSYRRDGARSGRHLAAILARC